jgi:hypothetical protein
MDTEAAAQDPQQESQKNAKAGTGKPRASEHVLGAKGKNFNHAGEPLAGLGNSDGQPSLTVLYPREE